jgi:predicted nuclease of predicted toxin-antitoxin system
MVKGHIQKFSLSSSNNINSEVNFNILLEQALDKEDLNILFGSPEKIVVLTEAELNNKIALKSARKSNPLLLNFEEYE